MTLQRAAIIFLLGFPWGVVLGLLYKRARDNYRGWR